MKIKLLAIAPYPGLGVLFNDLAKDLPEIDITVFQADMEESLPILKRYEGEGFDFILSRGGTAKLLEKHTTIPVIEVQVSGYDILRILTLLKGYQSKIQMVGFSNIIHSFEAVSTLMGMDILYTVISHEGEVEQALAEAKNNGIQVIVGDSITVRLAKNMGLQGVLITSGRESVIEAFNIIIKMNHYLSSLESKNRHFNQLFNKLDDGITVVDRDGYILFANPAFCDLFNISTNEEKRYSIFELYPYFARFIESKKPEKKNKIEVNLFDKRYIVSTSHFNQDKENEDLYLVKFTNVDFREHGFYIRYPEDILGVFPQLVVSGRIVEKALEKANHQMDSGLPICIYGEQGSGKRLLISLLRNKTQLHIGSVVELVINNPTPSSFGVLLKKLEDEEEHSIIHLIGFENVPPNLQKVLVEKLNDIRAQLIFSFTKDLKKMESTFDPAFLNIMSHHPIVIPPLRERLEEFEEFIRAFIFQFNEKYGKQIVGVHPKALESLKKRQWKGNFIELREITEELVRLSEEDFIDEKALSLLDIEETKEGADNSATGRINLNQPLVNIEKQVIQLVLEEENMNQSRAAKRLGINRSTLWRKIKSHEEA